MAQIQITCSVHGAVTHDGIHILKHLGEVKHNFGDYVMMMSDWSEPVITVVVPRLDKEGSLLGSERYKVVPAFRSVDMKDFQTVVEDAIRDSADPEAFMARETARVKMERGLV